MVNTIEKDLKNGDGTIDTLVISSNDNICPLDANKTYKLANYNSKRENALVRMYKNSIFGAEIGVKAEGFSNIAILATILAVFGFIVMYISWRV